LRIISSGVKGFSLRLREARDFFGRTQNYPRAQSLVKEKIVRLDAGAYCKVGLAVVRPRSQNPQAPAPSL
jgi:hypothetical protein